MNNNTRKKVRGLFLAAALLPLLAVQQVHASEGSVIRRINESTGQKARSLVPENIYGSGSRRSTEQKNGKSGQDVSDATGPGAGGAAEDTFQGPVVEDVRITETYHEDYRLYEEGLGEKAFFYSNIANGTWTDKPVRFEIPEQISVSASRDGAPYPFERGQAFAERGSYLLTLVVAENESLPFSAQKLFEGSFRFRIQEKPAAAPAGSGDSGEERQLAEIARSLNPDYENTAGGSGKVSSGGAETRGSAESVAGAGSGAAAGYAPVSGEGDALEQELRNSGALEIKDGIMSDDGTINEDRLSALISSETAGKKPESGKESTTYDPETGFYKHTLRSGDSFLSDIPDGGLTNQPVMIAENETLSFTLRRNGVPVEHFSPGEYIEQPGSYQLYPESESVKFKMAYEKQRPVFSFRILDAEAVSDLGFINLPEHHKVRLLRHDGKDVDDSLLLNEGRSIYLKNDGIYQLQLEGPAGSSSVQLKLDRIAPRFRVHLSANLAQIEYLSEDTALVQLYRGGRLVKEDSLIQEVNGAGSYRILVKDVAGNSSEYSFVIRYQVNTAAVIAILLCLALVGAAVFFFRNINKNVKVR